MDCTLQIIAGPENGQVFTCAGPETYIGRSQRCIVRLSSPAASFEHAVIQRTGDEFFIENLSANGTLLNNQRLTARTRLKPRDQVRVGDDTVIRVESLPAVAGGGSASRRLLLVIVLVFMVFGGLGLVIWDPFADRTGYDWRYAYSSLDDFVKAEVQAGRMQPDTLTDFRAAWRIENTGNRADARRAWLEVRVAVSDYLARQQAKNVGAEHKAALVRMLTHDKKSPPPTLEDLQAALDQFVTQMQKRK
ncbi:MAG TPA: FHA domain-containing protein [Phycisphaerae bacterium]|jgi:pSer/pThr/pTyr-binding forkhead associated (FHA) protein|nr:FHA domain-containing protein [Phycisphaerae bacterium]